ncbi:MAG: hypothetical protein NTZ09_03510 [Candidatus Hydrogenedentes bacterium]|nr:hypothetical protein [Candidatus Hydrogenedentota bacterium]
MSDAMKPETRQQMRDLCNKISVAHDLDESIQEELLGHMEDKFLAYLSGDEPLSDQDAFILVREHFGNPATVKSLMQEAHPGAVRASLARRIAAVAVAATALQVVFYWVTLPLDMLFWQNTALGGNGWLVNAYSVLGTALRLVVLGLILLRWQRMISAGRKPWFLKERPRGLIYLFILLVAVWMFTGISYYHYMTMRGSMYRAPEWFLYACAYVSATLSCLMWLWWCDRPPRTMLAMGAAAIAWLVYPLLRFTGTFIGVFTGQVTTGPGAASENFPRYAHTFASDLWQGFGQVLWFNGKMAIPSVAAAIALYLIYRLTRRQRHLPLAD